MDITKLQQLLRDNIGDVTFREAYRSTEVYLVLLSADANRNATHPKHHSEHEHGLSNSQTS